MSLVRSSGPSQSAHAKIPPIFLGRSLDLLQLLWGQLRLRSGLTPACSFSKVLNYSPKSTVSGKLWGFNQYAYDYRSQLPSSSLVTQLMLSFDLTLSLLFVGRSPDLFPAQTKAARNCYESSSLLGLTCSVGLERGGVQQQQLWGVGTAPLQPRPMGSCCNPQGVAPDCESLGRARLLGLPGSCGQGLRLFTGWWQLLPLGLGPRWCFVPCLWYSHRLCSNSQEHNNLWGHSPQPRLVLPMARVKEGPLRACGVRGFQ